MTITTSNARHLVFRLTEPARLPEALLGVLRDEVVVAGWMRASGVLSDVRIRALGSESARSLSGTVQAVVLEGSIGLSQGDVTCGLRAVLSRETDTGLQTLAGEIVEARVNALEVLVTALDDVTAARAAGPAGVWLLEPSGAQPRAAAAPAPAAAPSAPTAAPSAATAAPSAPAIPPDRASEPEPAKPAAKPSPAFGASLPLRPVKPVVVEEEPLYPDAGDVVEHFAFGRCDVVKSDGDRLHLRLGKDGRIKEIALEMLKVTPLPAIEGATGKHFRLDRKL
jgi:predicted DNA-binding protein with PD1-like motif